MLLISCLSCFARASFSYPKIGSIREWKWLPRVHYCEDCFKLAIRFRHSVIALLNSDHSWDSFARVRFRNRLVCLPSEFPKSAFDEVEWIQALAVSEDIMRSLDVLIAGKRQIELQLIQNRLPCRFLLWRRGRYSWVTGFVCSVLIANQTYYLP